MNQVILPSGYNDYSTYYTAILIETIPMVDIEKAYVQDQKKTFIYNLVNKFIPGSEMGLELLLMNGLNPNLKQNNSNYPIIFNSTFDALKVLLEYGADPNLTLKNKKTIIHHILQSRDMDIPVMRSKEKIQLLVAAGASLDLKYKGKTAREILENTNRMDLIKNNPYKFEKADSNTKYGIHIFETIRSESMFFFKLVGNNTKITNLAGYPIKEINGRYTNTKDTYNKFEKCKKRFRFYKN